MKLLKMLLTLSPLEGNRTYLVGYGLIVYAVLGYFLGQLTLEQAITTFGIGAGMAGLRAAVEKV